MYKVGDRFETGGDGERLEKGVERDVGGGG